MTKNKTIWDYFDDNIEYPSEIAHNPIPYGTVWGYVSSTFLNGFINYVKPISCFVLDRYTNSDEDISDRNVSVRDKNVFSEWHKWNGTKKELINAIITEEKEMYHTDINCFDDDVILLTEIETNENDGKGKYMFFWFDCDVSDCCVGKFETTDSKEMITQSIKNWLIGEIKEGGDIINYYELSVSFLQGWVSF